MSSEDKAREMLDAIGMAVDINRYVVDSNHRAIAQSELDAAMSDLSRIDLSGIDAVDFDKYYASIRVRDDAGAWHSVTSLAETAAELRTAFITGARRMGEQYGKATKITAFEIYVTEKPDPRTAVGRKMRDL